MWVDQKKVKDYVKKGINKTEREELNSTEKDFRFSMLK